MKKFSFLLVASSLVLLSATASAQTAAQRLAQQKAAEQAALKAQQQKIAMEKHFAEVRRINEQAARNAQAQGRPSTHFTATANAYNLNLSPAERARQQQIALREQAIINKR